VSADFRRYYAVDLRAACFGVEGWLGVRHLRELIDGLPDGCALAREIDPDSWWTAGDELAAQQVELLQYLLHGYHSVHSEKEPEWEPRSVPRPGQTRPPEPEPQSVSLAEFARLLKEDS
jgi:hypothetical protein